MSLLIKALDKAEKAQEEIDKAEQQKGQKSSRRRARNIANNPAEDAPLTLESTHPHNLTQEFFSSQYLGDTSAARAANVFDAKQVPSEGVSPMLLIAGFGLLALLSIGGYFYYQINRLSTPASAMAPQTSVPPTVIAQAPAAVTTPDQATQVPPTEINAQKPESNVTQADSALEMQPATAPVEQSETPLDNRAHLAISASDDVIVTSVPKLKKPKVKKARISTESSNENARDSLAFGEPMVSSNASMKISKSSTQQGINPVLVSAYQAYNAGKDEEAQALYKRVLQKDTRNIDALLGLGAIAERQGRESDALGWYRKVLEVEPRNPIALAAHVDNEADAQNKELKLKNLISREPNNANLYADLGAYYADQNQWGDAQQAYFEAYRLNPSAENAFNLAVGLDQMGKPNLALPYYQKAAELSAGSNNAIDNATLEARISAIQSQNPQ